MPADALKCKECSDHLSRSRRATSVIAASARWRWPTRRRRRVPDELKRRIQAGPHTLWRYADFLPLDGTPRARAAHGLDAAGEGRPPRRAPRPRRAVGQERDGQPDALLQGPRRLGRARSCAGARLPDDRLCLHGQPRQRRGGARRLRRAARLRADPGRPRGAQDPRHRRLRRQRGRDQGQLRRGQPPLHRARRRPRRLGVRQRQRAPLLRRGLQDAGLRGRRAARLGAPGPRRRAGRLGLAVHEARAGVRGVDRLRAARGRAADDERRPGRGLLPGRPGVRGRHRGLPPGQARHDRQVAGDRQPRRRPLRGRAGAEDRRRRRRGDRRRDPRRHPPARRDDRHLHRDRGRRHHRDARQARRARRHRPLRARRALHHRRRPEDDRRRPRARSR